MNTSKSKKDVLVIEDEELVQSFQAQYLQRAGYNVKCADDGQDGLQKLKECKPDVIVLDLVMPKMDGFEFLKKVRQNKELKDTPILVFTNLNQPTDIEKAKNLGADKFLVKVKTTLKVLTQEIEYAVK